MVAKDHRRHAYQFEEVNHRPLKHGESSKEVMNVIVQILGEPEKGY